MRTSVTRFLAIFLLSASTYPVFAQYHTLHEIDSVMDMSPYHLPTYYAYLNFIEFMPLNFKPIDTGMIATHLYEPVLRTENIYQNLGITGQAHQSMIFDYQRDMGFLYQSLSYPLYFKKQSDLKYYKLQTTYSRAAYTFGFLKNNTIFAEFTRYMRGITVAANIYATFNEGVFLNQTTRNICGDFLLHYELPSAIYGFRASYIINHLNNRENGGLLDKELYQNRDTTVDNRLFGVRSERATSKITIHDFALQNYVNIRGNENRYFGTITHDFQLGQSKMQHQDTIPPYYFNKPTNDSIRMIMVKNAIQWSNFSPFQEVSSKSNFFHIAGGLLHDYADLRYVNTSFNALYLFARTHIRLFNVMDITAQVSYSVVSDYGNNDLAAKASIFWTINREKEHKVELYTNYYRNDPEYIMKHTISNNFQ